MPLFFAQPLAGAEILAAVAIIISPEGVCRLNGDTAYSQSHLCAHTFLILPTKNAGTCYSSIDIITAAIDK